MLPTSGTSTLLSLQARVVFTATVSPDSTFPFHVPDVQGSSVAAGKDTTPGYQPHSAWCQHISPVLKDQQFCAELGSVIV